MQAVVHQPVGLGLVSGHVSSTGSGSGGPPARRKPGPGPGPGPGKGKGKGKRRHAQVLYLINMISESGIRAGGPCTVTAHLCAGDQPAESIRFPPRCDRGGSSRSCPGPARLGWAGHGPCTVAASPRPGSAQMLQSDLCHASYPGRANYQCVQFASRQHTAFKSSPSYEQLGSMIRPHRTNYRVRCERAVCPGRANSLIRVACSSHELPASYELSSLRLPGSPGSCELPDLTRTH